MYSDVENILDEVSEDVHKDCLLDRNHPDGMIPLHLACKSYHDEKIEIVEKLLTSGGEEAKKEQLQAIVKEPAEESRNTGYAIEEHDDGTVAGRNVLHLIAEGSRNEQIMRLLIEECVKEGLLDELIQQKNKDGNTPVHVAAIKGRLR